MLKVTHRLESDGRILIYFSNHLYLLIGYYNLLGDNKHSNHYHIRKGYEEEVIQYLDSVGLEVKNR